MGSAPDSPTARIDVQLAALALAVLLAAFVAAAGGRSAGDAAAADLGRPADEERARFGNIFIGTVVAVAGEDRVLTNDPDDVTPVIRYDVQAERTLKGEAAGRVRVWYTGFDCRCPGYENARELRVGERLMFFAGFDPIDRVYPVDAGVGVIPVKRDRKAARLVARFAPPGAGARLAATPAIPEDSCGAAGRPTFTLEPSRGAVGDEVRLSGTNLARPFVDIRWGGSTGFSASFPVALNCSIAGTIVTPASARGPVEVVARDTRGQRGEATFVVTTAAGATPTAGSAAPQVADETPPTTIAHASYAYDFRDARILVAYSSHVFLGRVVAQTGSTGLPTSAPAVTPPRTQFAVDVLEPIKGELPKRVTVSQESGIDGRTGELVLLDGDPLLEAGEVVLFATTRNPGERWHTIVAGPYGALRARDAAEAAELIARFQAAAQEQFLPVPDAKLEPPDRADRAARSADRRAAAVAHDSGSRGGTSKAQADDRP